ncbi:carboxypeptidase-like regulatory domain-containing protein [Uliginosibacterium sp. H1]|uniref:carboxypeptidase-like regulatory domain-containing protein n=1 Tax=Uliginosibacterium sp. H1 TaxID=3114757 RepID=UPI002E19A913|nr:carboxypeptidase-like regulatory domain-containing protein [Uliginosibacterium sp. H1]
MNVQHKLSVMALAVSVVALQACGGGGGGSGTAAPSGGTGSSTSSSSGGVTAATVSGVAAFGAPMAGATITLMDANGTKKSTVAAANGSYSIDVNGLTAPFLLTASGVSGDTVKTYNALLATAPAAGVVANVNVTPLTHAIVALASSNGASPTEFGDAAKLKALNTARLGKAETAIKTIIATVATNLGLPANFNPVSSSFQATLGQPADTLLETVKVAVTDVGVTLTNALAPVADSANAASATITLSNPDTAVTALPAASVTPSFNTLLSTLRTQLNNCLAQAPADRVTLDGNNKVTGLKGECTTAKLAAFESNYLSGGFDLIGRWGPRLRDLPKGATMAQAEIIGSFAEANGDTSVVLRLPFNVEQGGTSYNEAIIAGAGSAFKLTGNQRKYDLNITTRVYRIVDVSTNDRYSTEGNTIALKNIGRLSRWETAINFAISTESASAEKVFAARVKGPGLPAAGLVLARTNTCGTGGNLYAYSADGSLPDHTGKTAPFFATSSTGGTWRLHVEPLNAGEYKGSNLLREVRGWTTTMGPQLSSGIANPTNYVETGYDVASIQEFAKYTWEVFSIETNGALTTESFTTRLTDKPVGVGFAKAFAWATIDAASLDYLKPNTVKGGAITDATISWTNPVAGPLINQVSLSGSSVSPAVRFNMGEAVRPVGATSITLVQSEERDGLGNACSSNTVPAMSTTQGSRGLQIEQRGDRMRMIQNWSHQGRPVF